MNSKGFAEARSTSLVPQANSHAPQWFSIGCVIDPNLQALSDWLLQFDQMLEGLAGA